MNVKKFLKPSPLKISVSLLILFFSIYFAVEDACAVGLFFKFCYKAYGFPFRYVITGDIGNASDYANTFFLGEHFIKLQNFLFNPLTFLLDLIFIYLLACGLSMLFNKTKIKT